MKQSFFEQRRQAAWQRFDKHLAFLEKGKKLEGPSSDFVADYRRFCQQLALARERGYSSHLVDQLQQLAMRGHQQFYRYRSQFGSCILGFLLAGLPCLVREERHSIATASLSFYGSALPMGLLAYHFPDLIYGVVSPDEASEMESMCAPEITCLGPLGARDTSDDWEMFGFYIMNSIDTAFQTFASGMLLGPGGLFFLLPNGLMIGSVASHLAQIGYVQTFWPFVISHGAFELTAIAFAGAASLRLGWALFAPGRLIRGGALRLAARRSVQLIARVIVLLLLAAFTEAYWSFISHFEPRVKYAVDAVLWLLVDSYFLFAGRSRHAPD